MVSRGEDKSAPTKNAKAQIDSRLSASHSKMVSASEENPKATKNARTQTDHQRFVSPSRIASGGEENPKTPKESKTQTGQKRSALRSDIATEREERSKKKKESMLPKLYEKYKAKDILHVEPDEVKYLDYSGDYPCMAATNLHGAFVVVQVSPRASLMAHIAPKRESLEKPSDPDNPKDKAESIHHVKMILEEMRIKWEDNRKDLAVQGRYMVVAYAKFYEPTAAGAWPLQVELKTILDHMPTVPVLLKSYLVRNEHGSDKALNADKADNADNTDNPYHETVWLDTRKEIEKEEHKQKTEKEGYKQKTEKEEHITFSPVLWVGEQMIDQSSFQGRGNYNIMWPRRQSRVTPGREDGRAGAGVGHKGGEAAAKGAEAGAKAREAGAKGGKAGPKGGEAGVRTTGREAGTGR